MKKLRKKKDGRARVLYKARATKLISDPSGAVIGCEYEKDGKKFTEYGPVVLATGGYGADFTENSLIKKHRPDLIGLPTTNGEHCTGDGIKLAQEIGGDLKDIEYVQVHPTGLVHPDDPDAKVKWLAAEALRGTGGLLLDGNGKRFADELGRRDYVTGEMWKGKGPYRLVLNAASAKEIEWHCKHYQGRGLMKKFNNGQELAKDIGVSSDVIKTTFDEYNKNAQEGKDNFGKKYFQNAPYRTDDYFYVAIVCPVVHYCMGGLRVSAATEVETPQGKPVPGLWAAGEVMGGTHGINRLGGSSLLDCVVFGRVSGVEASKYLLQSLIKGGDSRAQGRLSNVVGQLGTGKTIVSVDQHSKRVTIEISLGEGGASTQNTSSSPSNTESPASSSSSGEDDESEDAKLLKAESSAKKGGSGDPAALAQVGKGSGGGSSSGGKAKGKDATYTLEDVAKHAKETDCWVVVNGQVLDVTKFLPDHPGGAKAILLYAGKDATEEFNMLHKPEVIAKYAPDSIIGKLAK